MIKLYHYVHCPFCVRVRMALGYLQIPYKSIVLPYNDEQTPLKLTNVKMLPIVEHSDGTIQNESLDIIARLDKDHKLKISDLKALDLLLEKFAKPVHSLCMPYWIWTPEFNEESRQYFQKKKEVKRGPFYKLIQNKNQMINELNEILIKELIPHLTPYYQSSHLGLNDILISAHLWGMYIFPEYQFPPSVHAYLQKVKEDCQFEYHADYFFLKK